MSDDLIKSLEGRVKALEEITAGLERDLKSLLGASGSPTNFGESAIGIATVAMIWQDTLKVFGIDRPVFPHENMKISQLVKTYGPKATMYALYGMRFEQATESFDPKRNIAIARAQDPKLFEKFMNLGAAEHQKRKQRIGEALKKPSEPNEEK